MAVNKYSLKLITDWNKNILVNNMIALYTFQCGKKQPKYHNVFLLPNCWYHVFSAYWIPMLALCHNKMELGELTVTLLQFQVQKKNRGYFLFFPLSWSATTQNICSTLIHFLKPWILRHEKLSSLWGVYVCPLSLSLC